MKSEKAVNEEQPKQKKLQKELEKKEKEERKRQLEAERKEKKEKAEREKDAKRIKLEAEKKARLDQKLREQREKEEQRLKREEEKRKKDEEKRKKDEEKRMKDEEKRKKEEERKEEKRMREDEKQKKLDEKRFLEELKHKRELEEKEKKEKEQNRFRSFFKQDSKSPVANHSQLNNFTINTNTIFKPFQLQPYQSLAPSLPEYIKQRFDSKKLDELILQQENDKKNLYLYKLKNGYQGYKWKTQRDLDVDVIIETEPSQYKYKAKLFQFHENNRPPYFGTWRKKSSIVSARRPFSKHIDFDYEVDSDDEWEEEEKGESIKDNDSELSDEAGDGYELDDMFVSHGYLSDDEAKNEEGTDTTDDVKRGILVKEEALFDEKKRPVKKLQPLVIGCIWKDAVSDENSFKILRQFSATYLTL